MRGRVLTVVTVTFNAAATLQRTIDSVARQDYGSIEYIVVDGASTDGTMDIVRRNDGVVARYVSERDKGLYDAMNKGLAMATGEFVWFVNAGDEIYSSTTAREVMRLGEGADVVYGETVVTSADGSELGLRRLSAPESLTWRDFRDGMLVCHQSFVVRREIAPKYDTRYRFSADYDWCVRVLKEAGRVVNTHQTLSRFLSGGATSANMLAGLKERFRIMAANYGLFPTIVRHVWFAFRYVAFRIKNGWA